MKNLCLENYGVHQLSSDELKMIEGGVVPLVVWCVVAFFAGTVAAY